LAQGRAEPLLTVTYRPDEDDPEQDDVFEFRFEDQRRTFGRDRGCDIVIWSALNDRDLTRVAGEIRQSDGELWVRNLSTAHELFVHEPGQAEVPLRRRPDGRARGYACSVPAPFAVITGPGGCRLEVSQLNQPPLDELEIVDHEPTETIVPEVPPEFRPLAAALCEPILNGGRLPAAYTEVLTRLDRPSLRSLRKDVERLCRLYTAASADLARRVAERRRRELARRRQSPDPAVRARALSLPEYYEVAHLLVRYRRITIDDLALLPARGTG
jgi:hypothetical protein